MEEERGAPRQNDGWKDGNYRNSMKRLIEGSKVRGRLEVRPRTLIVVRSEGVSTDESCVYSSSNFLYFSCIHWVVSKFASLFYYFGISPSGPRYPFPDPFYKDPVKKSISSEDLYLAPDDTDSCFFRYETTSSAIQVNLSHWYNLGLLDC